MKARALLGAQRKSKKHIPSLPYQEIPAFYKWLSAKDLVSTIALQFLILTAARTSEVRFLVRSEITDDIWTIPAERTKTNQERRVPLSPEAQKVIMLAGCATEGEVLFPNTRGDPISDAAMSSFMQREGYTARPHGFRATFRTWCEEQTNANYIVKEMALGHKVGSSVERAYQRSELLDKRRVLLNQWADFLLS